MWVIILKSPKGRRVQSTNSTLPNFICSRAAIIFLMLYSCSLTKCLTFCDPHELQMPGFLVLHYLSQFAQTPVHWVSDAIQSSHSLLPSSSAFSLSQHQGLFQWVGSSHQVAEVLEFQLQYPSLSPNTGCNFFHFYFPSSIVFHLVFFVHFVNILTSFTVLLLPFFFLSGKKGSVWLFSTNEFEGFIFHLRRTLLAVPRWNMGQHLQCPS